MYLYFINLNANLPTRWMPDHERISLIIDLDQTLINSSFHPIPNADFEVTLDCQCGGMTRNVYLQKRPYVDEFLYEMAKLYECVLFTASLPCYANPILDKLDQYAVFRRRLFRDSLVSHEGSKVKDLSVLGRDLGRVLIVDDNPNYYKLHPENAVPVSSWRHDETDTELRDLIPFLQALSAARDVRILKKRFSLFCNPKR